MLALAVPGRAIDWAISLHVRSRSDWWQLVYQKTARAGSFYQTNGHVVISEYTAFGHWVRVFYFNRFAL